MSFIPLPRHIVSKPWGRDSIPACFQAGSGRIGEIWFDSLDQDLPILIKWLFTSEKLSIQVHPNDAQARSRGLKGGKEECWIIIDAEPGAKLGIGLRETLPAGQLRAAALSGDIEALLHWVDVKPGDWFHIPPGTIHAIGAGITLVEIQQNHDVTYRLYDYGRPRDLHLDAGMAVSTAQPHPASLKGQLDPEADLKLITACPHFKIYHGRADQFQNIPEGLIWLIPIKGSLPLKDGQATVGDVLYGRDALTRGASADFTFLAAALT